MTYSHSQGHTAPGSLSFLLDGHGKDRGSLGNHAPRVADLPRWPRSLDDGGTDPDYWLWIVL